MSEKNIFRKFFPAAFKPKRLSISDIRPVASSSPFPSGLYYSREFYTHSFTGEKNYGEIGPIKNYLPDYLALRLRSWQSYTESEISKILIDRHIVWLISKGLKLQSEPVVDLLAQEGIKLDSQKFSKEIETRFSVYRKSKISDHSKMRNLDKIAKRAAKNAIIGGDVLCVLRFDGTDVNVQLIDGAHVRSQNFGTEIFPEVSAEGNRIIHGVEINDTGEHVGYHVLNKEGRFDFIEAKSKSTGLTKAFMIYGSEYRLDNIRGIPLLSVVLETLKKLERYKEAVVGSAEERAKIVYQIVHQNFSDGTNPNIDGLTRGFDVDNVDSDLPVDAVNEQLANKIAATTNKMTYNMTLGSEMKALESKNELIFGEFFDKNIDIICAVLGMPPNVAMQKYNDSFSASRAALKDWEHTLNVNRDEFSEQFYQPIFDLNLDVWILQNKVNAPGYLVARNRRNEMVLGAYRNARWIGSMIPHINPLVEVQAERMKLGTAAAHMPLTTLEAATEALNGGDSTENIKQLSEELESAEELNILPGTAAPVVTNNPVPPA